MHIGGIQKKVKIIIISKKGQSRFDFHFDFEYLYSDRSVNMQN